MSRRFELYRYRDPGGVSGTGVVAHGIQFLDGSVVLRWLSDTPSTSVWDDIDSLLFVHGHLGASEVRWLDPDLRADEPVESGSHDLAAAASSAALSTGRDHGARS